MKIFLIRWVGHGLVDALFPATSFGRVGDQEANEKIPRATVSCYPTLKYTLKVGEEFIAVDTPGCLNLRCTWDQELEKAHGVVYVVDSTDEIRFPVVRQEFQMVLNVLSNRTDACIVPCLIFATKNDLRSAAKSSQIVEVAGIAETCCKLAAPWSMMKCSALDWYSVKDGIKWLLKQIDTIRAINPEDLAQASSGFQLANESFYYQQRSS
ncbi:hypothetical protein BSKO_07055 [Bryopsis sp. KO-2023]|nr:hypothetical protein BSKO_07055 [Bryopsis sp. KO-2023]